MKASAPIGRNRGARLLLGAALVGVMCFAVAGPLQAQPAPAAPQNAPVPEAGDQAPAQPDAGNGGTEIQRKTTSFLELLEAGGWFMLPIGLCSLLGVTIIIERLVSLRRRRIVPPKFMNELRGVFNDPQRDRAAALRFCHEHDAPIARVMAVGIRKIPQGVESVEQGIEDAGANEVSKLRRNLRLLFGVASVAPMIGLLGTVWGMIEAFQIAEATGLGSSGSAQGLAKGIYTALVTTFAGLCVAIPLLVFYYFFLGKIERIVSEMNETGEAFVEAYLVDEEAASARTAATTGAAEPAPASSAA